MGRNVTTGLENLLCYILAVCPWASYLTSLDLNFLIYKIELKKYPPSRDIRRITFINISKALSIYLDLVHV